MFCHTLNRILADEGCDSTVWWQAEVIKAFHVTISETYYFFVIIIILFLYVENPVTNFMRNESLVVLSHLVSSFFSFFFFVLLSSQSVCLISNGMSPTGGTNCHLVLFSLCLAARPGFSSHVSGWNDISFSTQIVASPNGFSCLISRDTISSHFVSPNSRISSCHFSEHNLVSTSPHLVSPAFEISRV